ncbi:ABC transporter substrate-binding protein [Mobiluncus holmesii]|uniref:ABC transporter substrate-binding protein n=2 Tax=Mobiluncus porci TaxID=2652278 RepID=A0A7K0K4G7_9ACTO|nr:ABC transporter substrate-binding protein [Mobiluncus porci]
MKRIMATLALATLTAAGLSACSGANTGGNAAQGDTIKVGVNYELSGAVATYGQQNVDGIEMAFDEINAAGGVNGKKIEVVKYDSKSEPAEATTLATKLMNQDKVVTMIGPATSGSFKAVIPVGNQSKVPVVSGSATADDVTVTKGKLQDFAFRTCFSDSYQGGVMAKYAFDKLGAKTAVIYKDNSSDYAKGLAENFKKTFEEAGGKITGEEAYVAGDTDFNSVLTRLKGETFDVMYIPGYYQEVGLIIKQARGLGIDSKILGGDGFDSPTLLELAGAQALNNVYFTSHYSALDASNEKLQKFITDFKAKFGEDPSSFNALGYDTAYFVAGALGNAKELTGDAVKEAMASYKGFDGVTGKFDIDPKTHDPIKTAVVINLKDGEQAAAEAYGLK